MNNTLTRVPPGFRFHPTDEELVDYYLRKKVANKRIDLDVIKDIDLYKIEPWDLQEKCKIGSEEQTEWYFFSHKDKKYPTGTRTNRATTAGFWKATGRDKAIYSKLNLIGMRKTLVFYKGRAPNGQKSDWIMHEYRLETNENATPQEEGWVVCRVFKKRITTQRKGIEGEAGCWYDDQVGLLPELDSPRKMQPLAGEHLAYQAHSFGCKQELDLHYHIPHDPFLHLPQLESPKVPSSYNAAAKNPECSIPFGAMEMVHMDAGQMNPPREDHQQPQQQQQQIQQQLPSLSNGDDHVTDWRVLDKFVASQLSQEDVSNKEAGSPRFHSDNLYPIPDMSLLLKQSTKQQQQQQQNNFPSNDVDLWSFAGK